MKKRSLGEGSEMENFVRKGGNLRDERISKKVCENIKIDLL